jgi:predicted nucleic acid-binding protein
MGLILDTSVLIRAERQGLADPLPRIADGVRAGVSVITVSELLVGLHRATNPSHRLRRESFIADVLKGVEVFPMTLEIAHVHARLAADLAAKGQMIGAHDLIIAATALHLDWSVKTANAREFGRIEGLDVIAL